MQGICGDLALILPPAGLLLLCAVLLDKVLTRQESKPISGSLPTATIGILLETGDVCQTTIPVGGDLRHGYCRSYATDKRTSFLGAFSLLRFYARPRRRVKSNETLTKVNELCYTEIVRGQNSAPRRVILRLQSRDPISPASLQ